MKINTIIPKPKFYSNKEGELIEGFLDEDEFNCIIFLLKEPNSDGEPVDIFWFKKVLHNEDDFISKLETKTAKSAATKYPNYFKKCLNQIGLSDEELRYSVYMNLHPYSGEKSESIKYKKMLEEFNQSSERWETIENLNPEVIFTCIEIYNKIKDIFNIKDSDEIEGIKYKDKTLSCFEAKIGNKTTKVYAIYHPTASKSII